MEMQLDRFLDETAHPGRMAAAAFLMVMNGPEDGRIFPVTKDTVQIGRLDSNDVPLPLDPVVSRAHARLIREGDRHFICDLSSRFGTTVDGANVGSGERVELRHRSAIVVGETTLEFRKSTGDEGGER